MGRPVDEPGVMDVYIYVFETTPAEWHEVMVQAPSSVEARALARTVVPPDAMLLYGNRSTVPIEPRVLAHATSRPRLLLGGPVLTEAT